MFIFRLAAWATGLTLMIGAACSSAEQPEQASSASQEEASAPQAVVSQPAETADSAETTPDESGTMAETSAKPPESAEKAIMQEAPASEETPVKTAPLMSLGPNMIRVKASITNAEETGNSYISTLNVEQVLGLGPSTPSLVRGNEIKVRIKKVVGQSEKLASKDGMVEVTLQHAPPLATIQPPPPSWNVMEVH